MKKSILVIVVIGLVLIALVGVGIYLWSRGLLFSEASGPIGPRPSGAVSANPPGCPNTATIKGTTFALVGSPPMREEVPSVTVSAYIKDCNGSASGGSQVNKKTTSNYLGAFTLEVPLGAQSVEYTVKATKQAGNCHIWKGTDYVTVAPGQKADASVEMKLENTCNPSASPTGDRTEGEPPA